MLAFPQLGTGASASLPLRRRHALRTVVNKSMDGSRVVLGDPDTEQVIWDLNYSLVNNSELSKLTTLFNSAEGRLYDFVFLDPVGNLLAWSETLSNSVWQRNSLLELTADIADPLGTTRASRLTNIGGAPLRIEQTINAPAG